MNTHEILIPRPDGTTGRTRYAVGTSTQDAMLTMLERLRPGTLKRYRSRRQSLNVLVSLPGGPNHENGRPMILDSFNLTFGTK